MAVLTENNLATVINNNEGAVVRRHARIDDDDMTILKFWRHGIPDYPEGEGFGKLRTASTLAHEVFPLVKNQPDRVVNLAVSAE